jgi:hypothetical protein
MIQFDRLQARRAARPASKENTRLAQRAQDDRPTAAGVVEPHDAGMTTAEYAVGTIAACTLATGC